MNQLAPLGGAGFLRKAEALARLRRVLPEASVLFDPEDTRPYECDGLSA